MPSRRNCTPAVTTMSPACNPPAIRTPSSAMPPISTVVLRTTLFAASTTNATVPPSLSVSAVRGTTMGAASSSMASATDAVMPSRMACGGIVHGNADRIGPRGRVGLAGNLANPARRH